MCKCFFVKACALLSLESSGVSLDMSWVMSGQRMRRMICRGHTAAFLFALSAKLSTRSNSFSAHSTTHTFNMSKPRKTNIIIWYTGVFHGRTGHVRLWPLVEHCEFIRIILHPVPECLKIQAKDTRRKCDITSPSKTTQKQSQNTQWIEPLAFICFLWI